MKHIEDLKRAADDELVKYQIECEKMWSKYSCDCFGFYISALHKEITKRNIWLKVHEINKLNN